jgi:hypothetical protein
MRWWEQPRETMDPPVFLMRIMQQLKDSLLFNVITKKNAKAGGTPGACYIQGLFGMIMLGSLHFTNQICGRSIDRNYCYSRLTSKCHSMSRKNTSKSRVFPHLGTEPTGFHYALPLTHPVFDHRKFAQRVHQTAQGQKKLSPALLVACHQSRNFGFFL